MPKYYPADADTMRRVFPRAIAEQLVGSDEKNRTTKTFIPDRRMAGLLTLVKNHYQRIAAKLIVLHHRETGEVLTFDEVLETYQSVRTWKGFHDYLIEHLGSLEGFSTKAAVRAEMLRESENRPLQPALPSNGQTPLAPGQQNGGGGF